MKKEHPFIKQTALDYDMTYSEVEKIHQKYPETFDFYNALKDFIEKRKNS